MNSLKLTLGANVWGRSCCFRVWAPLARTVEVYVESPARSPQPLSPEGGGYFSGTVPGIGEGALYWYIIDGADRLPDPCSRFQPEGPHGPSMVVDPDVFAWHDAEWIGIGLKGQVIYELHIGTFTAEGDFAGAEGKLEHLKALGVATIEVMPVAECPGRWNWGYDGVGLFAPSHNYGDAHAFRHFVDRAHAVGLAVILDVVYNHLGPDGNYLTPFSPDYFSSRHRTEWGDAFNFDGEHSRAVRGFMIANAAYWIREFHLDGLRLDATQAIVDESQPHILAEIAAGAREAAGSRSIIVVAEDESQRGSHLQSLDAGGLGLDAMWNDDFHHSARVAATGRRHAYFHDYLGRPQEFVSAAKRGFLFQGQYYHWQRKPRGEPANAPLASFIAFLENHDQVANSISGARLNQLTSPGRLRALTALLLLGPATPLLFMGQEYGSQRPFLYFADHEEPLRTSVFEGRRQFLQQFPGSATPAGQGTIADPGSEDTFARSLLDWKELDANPATLQLHKDLIRLRREDPVIAAQGETGIDGAVLGDSAFLLRWFDDDEGDRLLLVNLGADLTLDPSPEPLLAPQPPRRWRLKWSTDEAGYGGSGRVAPEAGRGWQLAAESAVFLSSSNSR